MRSLDVCEEDKTFVCFNPEKVHRKKTKIFFYWIRSIHTMISSLTGMLTGNLKFKISQPHHLSKTKLNSIVYKFWWFFLCAVEVTQTSIQYTCLLSKSMMAQYFRSEFSFWFVAEHFFNWNYFLAKKKVYSKAWNVIA